MDREVSFRPRDTVSRFYEMSLKTISITDFRYYFFSFRKRRENRPLTMAAFRDYIIFK